MKTTVKKVSLLALAALILVLLVAAVAISAQPTAAFADDGDAQVLEQSIDVVKESTKQTKAWAAAIIIGVVAAAGTVAMSLAIIKSIDGIARQPEAESKIRTTLILGLVFIETAIIYALIVAIMVIFVL